MDRETRWHGLAPDLVRDVAGWLHDAGDFVRLHAVCKPWQGSRDAQMTTQFLPWLLAANAKDSSTPLRFRCLFSKASYQASSPPPSVSLRYWMGSTDATAIRYLTVEQLRSSLHDPLTGEVTHVPQLPFCLDGKDNLHGTVYADGSILLYHDSDDASARFRAALLRPGDAKWTLVLRTLQNTTPKRHGGFCAAYHGGKILVMEDSHWRLITPDGDVPVSHDVLVRTPPTSYPSRSNYVVESCGELLWVSVHPWITYTHGEEGRRLCRRTFYVLVHELEEEARWVKKDGCSLADRVLFLGSPGSCAIEASRLGTQGGCVYFVYYNNSEALPHDLFGVYRYNLLGGKAEFLERVPPGWDDDKCTWLVPQPAIASVQEIIKRSQEALDLKKKKRKASLITSPTSIIHILKHEPCFRVKVSDLPLTVNSSQLQLLFSKYGKVFDAKVLYFKRTKHGSSGFGLLTISTVHAHPRDALDAFTGPDLDGCSIQVTLVKRGRSFMAR